MCGLFGFIREDGFVSGENVTAIVERCLSTMAHRGPDGTGFWIDAEAGVAFGHLRLSVIELSNLGAQPMQSKSGRYVIIYNGEIYNFLSLRRELEACGHVFEGHSDTSVLLAGFEQWGIVETCRRANGMFAFALWDRHERNLTLARDHFGQKPLYYGWMGDTLLFASELKPIVAHSAFRGEIDRNAMHLFLRHGYVPHPRSIWSGISKLVPGSIVTFSPADLAGLSKPDVVPFWSAAAIAAEGLANPFYGNTDSAADELERLLSDAVRQCMVSDVPIGVFLSGGIDSSLITALMQKQSTQPARSFSIGYADRTYDESRHAAAVARHLGTDHTELLVRERDALDLIPSLPDMFDEPFADSSQIPTHLVAKLARTHVTVSLSGDAGDELFAGYNRYVWGRSLARGIDTVPAALRALLCAGTTGVSPEIWDQVFGVLGAVAPKLKVRQAGDKLHKLSRIAAASSFSEAYLGLTSYWLHPADLTGYEGPESPVLTASSLLQGDHVASMMLADTLTYLPDDILTKVDRATMAVSLESRAPFLDPRIFALAWRLPMGMKLSGGVGKHVVREILYRHVPKELVERPKMGFAVPIGDWLRGALRDWAESLLSVEALEADGFLIAAPIRQAWQDHLSGRRNWQHQLWAVLMFQAWRQQQDSLRTLNAA